MATKSRSGKLGLWIGLVLVVAAITAVEVYDLHPEFSVGRFHSLWVGFRHMRFESGVTTAPVRGGSKVIQRDYDLGPIQVDIEG